MSDICGRKKTGGNLKKQKSKSKCLQNTLNEFTPSPYGKNATVLNK